MSAICLAVALAGSVSGGGAVAPAAVMTMAPGEARLAASVTLRWTHSIEKIEWAEDYHIEDGQLRLTAARVRGSGAGMEVPDGAVLRDGVWHYRPGLPLLPRVQLRHSPYVPPYRLCSAGVCRPVTEWLPGLAAEAVLELAPCAAVSPANPPSPADPGNSGNPGSAPAAVPPRLP